MTQETLPLRPWLAAALLTLLPLLLLAKALAPGAVLADAGLEKRLPWASTSTAAERALPQVNEDTVRESLVYRVYLHETLGRGEMPWWSPHAFAGIPFVALSNTQSLYPPSIALAAFDPLAVHGWLVAFHLIVAGLGARLWLRSLGCSEAASLLGAMAFALNGMFATRHGHPQYVATACWLPFALLGIEWIAAGRRAGIACTATAIAMSVLAGHPSIYVFGFYFVAAYGGLKLLLLEAGARSRLLLGAAIAAAIGLGLASMQLLATSELAQYSDRGARALEQLDLRSSHWSHGLRLLFPQLFGAATDGSYWSVSSTPYAAGSLTVGIAPLLAASVGAFRGGRLGAGIGVIALLALATIFVPPLFALAYHLLPGFDFSRVDRLAIAFYLAVPPLAAFGFDACFGPASDTLARRRVAAWAVAAFASAALLALLSLPGLAREASFGTPPVAGSAWALLPPIGLSAAFALAAAACVALASGRARRVAAVAFLLLAAVDLFAYASGQVVVREADRMFRVTPSIRALQEAPGLFRIAKFGGRRGPRDYDVLPANTATVFGIQDFHGFGPMHPRHLDTLLRAVEPGMGRSAWHLRPFTRRSSLRSPVLDVIGAKYLVSAEPLESAGLELLQASEDGLAIYENRGVLPRVGFVPDAEIESRFGVAATRLASGEVDPRKLVLLHGVDALPQPLGAEGEVEENAEPETQILSYAPGRIEVRHRASSSGYLLLLESWFPGWRAVVDGRVAPTLRADVSFQALPIAAGEHLVIFEYLPTYRTRALGITGLAAAALFGSWIFWKPRSPGARP